MHAIILGVGNIILSDEGVGVHAVKLLRQYFSFPSTVDIVDGGTMGIELFEVLANKDLLIIVDTLRAGEAPGTVVRLAGRAVPQFFQNQLSPHQVGISDLLACLQLSGVAPKEIVLLGVEPETLELGLGLSPVVASAISYLLDGILAELAVRNIVPRKISPCV